MCSASNPGSPNMMAYPARTLPGIVYLNFICFTSKGRVSLHSVFSPPLPPSSYQSFEFISISTSPSYPTFSLSSYIICTFSPPTYLSFISLTFLFLSISHFFLYAIYPISLFFIFPPPPSLQFLYAFYSLKLILSILPFLSYHFHLLVIGKNFCCSLPKVV